MLDAGAEGSGSLWIVGGAGKVGGVHGVYDSASEVGAEVSPSRGRRRRSS